MVLSPVDLEISLIMKNNYYYPKNKEEFMNYIEEIDKNVYNREKILSKVHRPCFNIMDYVKDFTEEHIQAIINNII